MKTTTSRKTDITNRRGLAKHFGVSQPTIDDWVVLRGCPAIRRGRRGAECEFSISEVQRWRDADLQRRGVRGLHKNPLRLVANDSALFFLRTLFNNTAGLLDYCKDVNLDAMQSRKLLCLLYMHARHFLHQLTITDAFDKVVQRESGFSMDELMLRIQPALKSFVDSTPVFDPETEEFPDGLSTLMNEYRTLKKKADGKR